MKRSSIFFLELLVLTLLSAQINCRGIHRRKPQINTRRRRLHPKFGDIHTMAGNFVTKKSKELKRDVLWWDIYGTNPYLKKNKKYKDFKINVHTNDIVFGKSRSFPAQIRSSAGRWLQNRGNEPKEEDAFCEHSSQITYRWLVTEGISTKATTKANAHVSSRLGVDNGFRDAINLQMRQPQTDYPRLDKFKTVFTVPLPPRTAVKVDCYVRGDIVSTQWAARVDFEGWIAIWYTEKYLNHHLWFYRITNLANNKLHRLSDDCSLAFVTRGTFSAFKSMESKHMFTQHRIHRDGTFNYNLPGRRGEVYDNDNQNEDEEEEDGDEGNEDGDEEGDEDGDEEEEEGDDDDNNDNGNGKNYPKPRSGDKEDKKPVTEAVIEKPCDDAYEGDKKPLKERISLKYGKVKPHKTEHSVLAKQQIVVDLVPDDLPTEKGTW